MALKLRPVNKKPEILTVSRAPTNRLIRNRLRLSLPPLALFLVNSYFIDSLMNLVLIIMLLIGASLMRSPRKNSWKDPFPAGEGCGWTDHSFRIMNKKECCFNLPPLIEAILPDPRDITLQRREKTGDFGFSLRRSVVVDRSSDQPSRYQLPSRLVLKIINKFN